MSVKSAKKKPAFVFVPSKPWAARERSKSISAAGKGTVPAGFFEQVYIQKGRKAVLGKKGIVAVSEKVLNRLLSNPRIPRNLNWLLFKIAKEERVSLSEKGTLSKIDSITKALDRAKFSKEEFSFLEELRVSLIHYLIREFGRQV